MSHDLESGEDLSSLPLFSGVVRWFSATKGYGFIGPLQQLGATPDDSSATSAQQPDAFVHQNQLRCTGFRDVAKGATVQYRLKITDKGKHIALAVTGPQGEPINSTTRRDDLPPSSSSAPFSAFSSSSSSSSPSPYSSLAHQPYDGRNLRPQGVPFFTGRVKSWDLHKGFGFVHNVISSSGDSSVTPVQLQHDVFLHSNHLHAELVHRQLVPGMMIEFTLGNDEKKNGGKALALHVSGLGGALITREDIERAGGSDEAPMRRGAFDPSSSSSSSSLFASPFSPSSSSSSSSSFPRPANGQLTGVIERFDLSKKFGFIRTDGPESRQVFLHASRVHLAPEEIRVGLRVMFGIGRDHTGKDAAIDVIVLGADEGGRGGGGGERGARSRSPSRRGNGDMYGAGRERERMRSPSRDPQQQQQLQQQQHYDPYRLMQPQQPPLAGFTSQQPLAPQPVQMQQPAYAAPFYPAEYYAQQPPIYAHPAAAYAAAAYAAYGQQAVMPNYAASAYYAHAAGPPYVAAQQAANGFEAQPQQQQGAPMMSQQQLPLQPQQQQVTSPYAAAAKK